MAQITMTNHSLITCLIVSNSPNIPVIASGDWNATYCTIGSKSNIDIINMKLPPSQIRSGWLSDICRDHDLLDPYRAFHPTTREFSYTPRDGKKNRSRLDFFLISNNLLPHVKKCSIAESISTDHFDHKAILLDFSKEKTFNKLFINRTILSNPRIDDVVLSAYADTYLAHASLDQPNLGGLEQHVFGVNPARELDRQKNTVGTFIRLLKEYNNIEERRALDKNNRLLALLSAEKLTEISMQRDLIWDTNRFSSLRLNCDSDFF
jgi:hypothetical protein